ncbi:zinc-binding alcohol dehydrogenase family protein [Variovorax terrae]|uniref:Zinc-type alcohol dehydrogenase-like protein n=1 Tax=Variovorax terrae TaxID=2923278 RepID=A0A9X1VXB7_9BURK|nr:zinc-binding alcohol dehydrogenase family protein [Variovorax terrae]MCJ0765102.1 zinc-binding alcohol dehydrogenase family protein [Variovorax terrae]
MKAVGYFEPLPIDQEASLVDIELPIPPLRPFDLLVRVQAVSVNPVDTKLRRGAKPAAGEPRILGFDAAGLVEAVGPHVTRFKPGDRVFYAGAIDRPGTNAELHAVDERIAGRAPATLDDAEAAALPLTAITAWELLFDRLRVGRGGGQGQTLLVLGGAGGVGSILVQLARRLTSLRVIATASREETRQWCLEMGAHDVIDHSRPLRRQIEELGLAYVDKVASLTETDRHFAALVDITAPQGQIALIDDPQSLDATLLKRKSISLHWELMFTRTLFGTPDLAEQGRLLDEVAQLVDRGELRTTAGQSFGSINAKNLRQAHAWIESGQARGKCVLAGFV